MLGKRDRWYTRRWKVRDQRRRLSVRMLVARTEDWLTEVASRLSDPVIGRDPAIFGR